VGRAARHLALIIVESGAMAREGLASWCPPPIEGSHGLVTCECTVATPSWNVGFCGYFQLARERSLLPTFEGRDPLELALTLCFGRLGRFSAYLRTGERGLGDAKRERRTRPPSLRKCHGVSSAEQHRNAIPRSCISTTYSPCRRTIGEEFQGDDTEGPEAFYVFFVQA